MAAAPIWAGAASSATSSSTSPQAGCLTVIEILWQEIQRIAPKSLVLKRAKHHLDELKALAGEH